jgi:hypothetical protein
MDINNLPNGVLPWVLTVGFVGVGRLVITASRASWLRGLPFVRVTASLVVIGTIGAATSLAALASSATLRSGEGLASGIAVLSASVSTLVVLPIGLAGFAITAVRSTLSRRERETSTTIPQLPR